MQWERRGSGTDRGGVEQRASGLSYTDGSDQVDDYGNGRRLRMSYATNTSGAPATNRVIGDSTGAAFGYDQAGNMTSARDGHRL